MSGIDEMPKNVKAKRLKEAVNRVRESFCDRFIRYPRISDYAHSCERYYHFRLNDDELWENVGD